MFYGIDLGTTQTVITKYNELNRKYSLIPIFYEHYCNEFGEESSNQRTNQYILPSEVYVREKEQSGTDNQSGEKEYEYLIGRAAMNWAKTRTTNFSCYYTNPKAQLEANLPVDEYGYSASRAIYELLRACFLSIRADIESSSLGSKLPKTFLEHKMCRYTYGISTPLATNTRFSTHLIEQAKEAARSVGIKNADAQIRAKEEPTAALSRFLDYSIERMKTLGDAYDGPVNPKRGVNQAALVIDLGGGTSDIAIRPFYIEENDKINFVTSCVTANGRVVSQANNPMAEFGGMDFDDRICSFLLRRISQKYRLETGNGFLIDDTLEDYFGGSVEFIDDISQTERERITRIITRVAKEIKEQFSDLERTVVELADVEHLRSREDPLRIPISITREEYLSIIRPLIYYEAAKRFGMGANLESIEHLVDETKSQANLDFLDDLDFVYLTGGTSNIPEIREWLKKYINGCCPIVWANEQERREWEVDNCLIDIANGVAFLCDKNNVCQKQEMSLANAVLIDMQEGLPQILIPKGKKCPDEGTLTDAVLVESLVGINITLYSAPDEYSPSIRIIGSYKMAQHEIIPPGTRLSFHYTLDLNKQMALRVSYRDDNNRTKEVQLVLDQHLM